MFERTERYFETIKKYRAELRRAWEGYERSIERLHGFEGSRGYVEKMAKAAEDRDKLIKAARQTAVREFYEAIEGMKNAINNRKAVAPTPAEMSLIEALKLRKHITADDLDETARAITNNNLLRCLDEIAAEKKIPGKKRYSKMTSAEALEAVEALEENAAKICGLNKAGGSGKSIVEAMEAGDEVAFRKASTMLYVDRDPADTAEAMHRFGGVDRLGEFESIVNAI